MRTLKLTLAFTLILFLASGCTSLSGSLPIPDNLSQAVIDTCKVEGELECHGNCMDGFGATCYYDPAQYQLDTSVIQFYFDEETENACFAIHSSSVCGDCHNTFKLRENGVLEEVSCEEFFQAIEDKNQECNNCLDTLFSGCC
jgi:hypothetical protein